MKKVQIVLAGLAILVFGAYVVFAQISKPYTFSSNTPIKASEVNANFDVLYNAVNSSSSGIPQGVIVMWSGSTSNIPSGWALCNGLNGTPDLRDRFIVGAGSSYAVGIKGGASSINLAHSHTVSSHSHSITAEAPATSSVGDHLHYINLKSQPVFTGDPDPTKSVRDGSDKTAASQSHTHYVAGNSGGGGTHSHTVNSHSHGGATGSSAPTTNSQLSSSAENRPPYYALCFIMKL